MEIVALAQCAKIARADSAFSIEQTIANIHGPSSTCEEQRKPAVQLHAGRPCKCECPHDGDRGCIEAGEMP